MTDTVRVTSDLIGLLSDGAPAHSTNRQLIRDIVKSFDVHRAAEINIKDAPYNATEGSDISTILQNALTAAAGVARVRVPWGSSYTASAGIPLPSNTHLIIDGTVRMSSRLDYLFTATSKSNIHIEGIGKVKGTNTTVTAPNEERLFLFITCSDLSMKGIELSEVTIGAQFQSCTDWDFDCRCMNINTRNDNSEGYGILANLDNARWRIAGRYYNIERHAIYTGAGAQCGVIDDVVIDGCDGAAISIFATSAQNPCKNIAIGSIVIRNVGRGSTQVSRYGINVSTNVENLSIGSDVIIDTVDDDGIHIEGGSTETPAVNPRNISIGCPLLTNIGGTGIKVVNASRVSIQKPVLRNITGTGIITTVTGTGTGSFTDNVLLESYDIDTAANGINFSGDALLTNCSLGFGHLRNIAGLKFIIPVANTVRYNGPGHTLDFTELTLIPSQSDNVFVANLAAAFWVAPEAGYLTELFGGLNAAISAGTLTIKAGTAGAPNANLQTTMTGGGASTFSKKVPIGIFPVAQGALIEVFYTSDALLAPSTRNCLAQLRFVPFP